MTNRIFRLASRVMEREGSSSAESGDGGSQKQTNEQQPTSDNEDDGGLDYEPSEPGDPHSDRPASCQVSTLVDTATDCPPPLPGCRIRWKVGNVAMRRRLPLPNRQMTHFGWMAVAGMRQSSRMTPSTRHPRTAKSTMWKRAK